YFASNRSHVRPRSVSYNLRCARATAGACFPRPFPVRGPVMTQTPAADQYRKLLAHNIQLKLENFLKSTGPLTVAELAAIVLLDQEHHWRAGVGPRAENYFERFPQLRADAQIAVELIEAEYRLRQALGEQLTAAGYATRFPEFAEQLTGRLPAD